MDSITHVALGVVISESTFRRRIGGSANWLAAIAAASPDLDVVGRWFTRDPWLSLEIHRGATHSLLVAPVIALLWAGLFWLFRRRQFRLMYALALMAVLSHPLLDLCTSYGTQLLWPLSMQRFALDYLPIIDVFFTPILLATILACWLAQRIGRGGTGAGAGNVARRIGLAGLALACAYAGVGAWADCRTVALARATVPSEHGEVVRVRSGPLLGNVFARRIAVRTPDGYYVARYNLLLSRGSPDWHWAASATGPFVAEADRLAHIVLFRWFTMGMARPVVDRAADGQGRSLVRVTYHDMRYGYPADAPESIFTAEVIFDEATGEVRYGPARNRWRTGQESPEGVLQFFQPRENQLQLDGNRLQRMRTMWHESWKP